MYKPTLNFITEFKNLTQHKDRYIKGNSLQLLKRLQELNLQEEEAHFCPFCNTEPDIFTNCECTNQN